jgi:hypothetical protein
MLGGIMVNLTLADDVRFDTYLNCEERCLLVRLR